MYLLFYYLETDYSHWQLYMCSYLLHFFHVVNDCVYDYIIKWICQSNFMLLSQYLLYMMNNVILKYKIIGNYNTATYNNIVK